MQKMVRRNEKQHFQRLNWNLIEKKERSVKFKLNRNCIELQTQSKINFFVIAPSFLIFSGAFYKILDLQCLP